MIEGSFLSGDNKSEVKYYIFENKKVKPIAVLQISHGMQDYIFRYKDLIDYLNQNGIVVCGNDDLGHGYTSKSADSDGFFSKKDGYKFVVNDLHTTTLLVKDRYKNIPYFMLGHSMGSFFARYYAYLFPNELNGLILEGTSGKVFGTSFGIFLAKCIQFFKGPKSDCKTIEKTMLKSYFKYIDDVKTGKEWVTSDEEKLKEYENDSRCNFKFSASAYKDMLTVLKFVNSDKCVKDANKELPIFIVAGSLDPVGNYGKGVCEVYSLYEKHKYKDIKLKLYPNARHELHNEKLETRQEFFEDVATWVKDRINWCYLVLKNKTYSYFILWISFFIAKIMF